jgi:hypothetical protein
MIEQGKYIDRLVTDLLHVVHQRDETMYMATVIGALELVKQQLITESLEDDDE